MKTYLYIAIAIVGIGASSPSFAKVRFHDYDGQSTLINREDRSGGVDSRFGRQDRPSGIDSIYQSPFSGNG